jgi:hypothetical protein
VAAGLLVGMQHQAVDVKDVDVELNLGARV